MAQKTKLCHVLSKVFHPNTKNIVFSINDCESRRRKCLMAQRRQKKWCLHTRLEVNLHDGKGNPQKNLSQ